MPGGKSMNITHLDKKSTQADEINNIKSGIMQPYFFPYIGYWQLINAVDYFVLLDDVNYITRGYIFYFIHFVLYIIFTLLIIF